MEVWTRIATLLFPQCYRKKACQCYLPVYSHARYLGSLTAVSDGTRVVAATGPCLTVYTDNGRPPVAAWVDFRCYFSAHEGDQFGERPDSLRFWSRLTYVYSYIKVYTFLVILIPHMSPVVVFRLEKNRGDFSKWRRACTPVSFYNSEKGPRPSLGKWPRPQGPVVKSRRGSLGTVQQPTHETRQRHMGQWMGLESPDKAWRGGACCMAKSRAVTSLDAQIKEVFTAPALDQA